MTSEYLIAGVLGYLLGSIPFGFLVARAKGIDVRAVGSGNIGATNVARSLGRKSGAVVLLLDAAKGAGPVAALRWLDLPLLTMPFALTVVGVGAIVGHCFPVWLRFRGGKGVATSLGIFLVVSPPAAGIAIALWIGLYLLTRISSIGSLGAAVTMPGLLWLFDAGEPGVLLGCLGAVVVLVKHQANIRRLFRGKELKV